MPFQATQKLLGSSAPRPNSNTINRWQDQSTMVAMIRQIMDKQKITMDEALLPILIRLLHSIIIIILKNAAASAEISERIEISRADIEFAAKLVKKEMPDWSYNKDKDGTKRYANKINAQPLSQITFDYEKNEKEYGPIYLPDPSHILCNVDIDIALEDKPLSDLAIVREKKFSTLDYMPEFLKDLIVKVDENFNSTNREMNMFDWTKVLNKGPLVSSNIGYNPDQHGSSIGGTNRGSQTLQSTFAKSTNNSLPENNSSKTTALFQDLPPAFEFKEMEAQKKADDDEYD